MATQRSISALILMALVLCLGLAAGPAKGNLKPPAGYALVGEGKVARTPWFAVIHKEHQLPCIEVMLSREGLNICEDPSPLTVVSVTVGRESSARSAVAVMADRPVGSVHLVLRKRSGKRIHMRLLSDSQSVQTRLSRPLWYGATGLSGPMCLVRYVAFSKGVRVFESDKFACNEEAAGANAAGRVLR